jgi:hypothetical protein
MRLFRAAHLHLCADGGANRVYDEMPLFFPHEDPSDVRNRFCFLFFKILLYYFFLLGNYFIDLIQCS